MRPSDEDNESELVHTGGVYDVTEDGIRYRHIPPAPTIPRDGNDFLARLKRSFKMRILEHPNPNELVFEMLNVDVSFANALRRIMIAEVPTVAIEHVYMWNNSSILHDEVLSHRIGLVPIDVDPRLFDEFVGDDDEATDRNTVVFRLGVSCPKSRKEQKKEREDAAMEDSRRGGGGGKDDSIMGDKDADETAAETSQEKAFMMKNIQIAIDTPGRPYTKHVYSKDLQWVPQGDQQTRFPGKGIRPVHEDILLAKLRPGQVIELEAHGRIGVGKDHAKYSPVATTAYRLMPHVELLEEVYDELADELDLYEPGVFKIVPCREGVHSRKAVVNNPYACTMSRNFMRNERLKRAVKITRKPNHFIFSIESVGMIPAAVILAEALKVLKAKCNNMIRMADESLESEGLD